MNALLRLAFLSFCTLWACSLSAQSSLPANMYADTVHAPFLYGVASGDPLSDRVLLWTKVEPPAGQGTPTTLTWEISTDNAFSQIVGTGTLQAGSSRDWTVQVDATGLQPYTRYWYRFRDPQGNYSVTGRTQTAPVGTNTEFRLAIASCSSVFSGYFNAYRRIGQRHDIDLVVHLGDYIYDHVDADEQVRVPVPTPSDPTTYQDWRDRHEYYLLDPDLRQARARHPWAAIWDNHDLDGTNQNFSDAKRAYLEYMPVRLQDTSRIDRIYRKLNYGDLVELYLIDATTLRDVDTLPNGEYSILGDTQWTWLSGEWAASTATWRLVGNERMIANLSLQGMPTFIPYGDGPVADSGAWDGYNGERVRMLSFLQQNSIDNTVFLSGDIHMSFACDLAPDNGAYDPQTGAGSAAVEFLPTSISRGNFDEQGFGGFAAQLAQFAMTAANPHHVYEELESHGYGILDLRPARAVAEFWYSDILQYTNSESFATAFQCLDGANHWDRNALGSPTVAIDLAAGAEALYKLQVAPNPFQDRVEVAFEQSSPGAVRFELISASTGQLLATHPPQDFPAGSSKTQIQWEGLPDGMYLLRAIGTDGMGTAKVLKASR